MKAREWRVNVYLAGRAEDHEKVDEIATTLRQFGFKVVSVWHKSGELANLLAKQTELIESLWDPSSEKNDNQPIADSINMFKSFEENENRLGVIVARCKQEIADADWVIADANGAGMEAGYAQALGKEVIMFGGLPSALASGCKEHTVDWITACTLLSRHRGHWCHDQTA